MNIIDFLQTGGYRFKQATLQRMQTAYLEIMKAFVSFIGVSDVGNYIITGCEVIGANITSGMMYIDGELCPFEGASGDDTTKIKKKVDITNLPFKSGASLPVFRKTTAVVDEAGTDLSDFIRIYPVFDENYVHTDNNFTDDDVEKLAGIEEDAQKNVIPDFAENNPESPKYIENKPNGNLLTYLTKGTYSIGDPAAAEDSKTVSFTSVGTINYMVVGCLVSKGTAGYDNDITYVIRNKTANSFVISLNETGSVSSVQDLDFDYVLIPF